MAPTASSRRRSAPAPTRIVYWCQTWVRPAGSDGSVIPRDAREPLGERGRVLAPCLHIASNRCSCPTPTAACSSVIRALNPGSS